VSLTLPGSTSIADLKRTVLTRSRIRRAPAEYVVKYNGAELYEPGKTLTNAGIVPNSALIVLRRRRDPVR
jgi:hypothetical protein